MAYQDGRGFYAENGQCGYHGRLGSIHFNVQWIEWICFWSYNWLNFTFIHCACEYDPIGPSFEVDLGILGFCCRLSFALPWTTERSQHLKETIAEIDLDPDNMMGSLMLPIDELRKLRLGQIEAHTFEHAGETYDVTKRPTPRNLP